MRLGISSYTYTWAVGVPGQLPAEPLDSGGLLSRAVRLGVGVLQIADNLPLERLAKAELDALRRSAGEAGIQLEVGTRGIGPDHLRRYVEIASCLGSSLLRVVIDTADHKPSPEEVIEVLIRFVPELERQGITLAIENHDRFAAAAFVEIIERVAHDRVGICLDTVNSFGAAEGVNEVVDALAPLTVNLHVKDFQVRRVDHQMGFVVEGCPAGQGQLNVPWLLGRIRGNGRQANAIIELWTPPAESLEATIAREDDWAGRSVAYMKTALGEAEETETQ